VTSHRAQAERSAATRFMRPGGHPPRAQAGTPRRAVVPDFSTIVGPQERILTAIRSWDRFLTGIGLPPVDPPVLLPMPGLVERFGPRTPRIAVIRHLPGFSMRIVAQLRRDFDQVGIFELFCEQGFYLSLARPSREPPTRSATISIKWRSDRLQAIADIKTFQLPPRLLSARNQFVRHAGPTRVALVDTGDVEATTQVMCYGGFRGQQASDDDGHGTAIAALVRRLAPNARLTSYRVMVPGERQARSYNVLHAINMCLQTQPGYHVINISLTAPPSTDPDKLLGESLEYLLSLPESQVAPRPTIVTAAGNGSGTPMTYPALLPGVEVALASDWNGRLATYNCKAPDGLEIKTVVAPGGLPDDPFGFVSRSPHRDVPLYGSSFAAALITGALAS
jgi:Subtilase family